MHQFLALSGGAGHPSVALGEVLSGHAGGEVVDVLEEHLGGALHLSGAQWFLDQRRSGVEEAVAISE